VKTTFYFSKILVILPEVAKPKKKMSDVQKCSTKLFLKKIVFALGDVKYNESSHQLSHMLK